MSIGAVLDETWTLFTRFFGRFFVIAIVVFGAINLLYALVVSAISADNDGTAFVLALLAIVTVVVGTTWLQGAFVYAVQDARDGTFDASIRRCSRVSRPRSSRFSWQASSPAWASPSVWCCSSCRASSS